MWTAKAEAGIDGDSLREVLNNQQENLDKLVKLVRSDLENLARLTISTMIVLDVHGKDVIQDLINKNINQTSSFEWQLQLRYYFQEGELIVKMVNTQRIYGFEYLGNQTRLVITPLTDRCYRTLMGALHLNLGGAPEGPAGTGKTETTKDLAKIMAKKCIVFNCSDSLDTKAMAKFFTGLCFCGAWACFDEFNRIDLEVLSVIAQQILQIQTIIRNNSKRRNVNMIFEGHRIVLDPTCAIFITMNPSYAGRSDLPDNLKVLFRPVAMMVPDYAMIAEIYLYSLGFHNARNLSIKLTNSLRLASEQLSVQAHYDYGMRALITIIKAAGFISQLAEDENQTIWKAIKQCNLPKFISEDLNLFKGIMIDLFPDIHLDTSNDDKELEAYIKLVLKEKKLQETPNFVTKVLQLYQTQQVRHGIMILGKAMCGKTECINTLADSIIQMNTSGIEDQLEGQTDFKALSHNSSLMSDEIRPQGVDIFRLNPKAVTSEQLYGYFDPTSHD